jgi:hypothetical protein
MQPLYDTPSCAGYFDVIATVAFAPNYETVGVPWRQVLSSLSWRLCAFYDCSLVKIGSLAFMYVLVFSNNEVFATSYHLTTTSTSALRLLSRFG